MKCGMYRTNNGSTVEITGRHCGVTRVEFDWLEEGGCCDCVVEVYPDGDELCWHCDACGGGAAKLFRITVPSS